MILQGTTKVESQHAIGHKEEFFLASSYKQLLILTHVIETRKIILKSIWHM
jgi:hypothetical protein